MPPPRGASSPPPTDPDRQRRDALRRANEVRIARAAVKRAIQEGRLAVGDVLRSCPAEARSMPIGELLGAQHRWGEARTLRTLRRIPVSETKPVGGLTPRQRRALIESLAEG